MMALGFLAARRLPVGPRSSLVAVLELVPLLVIRDNLTLNVWMLLAPNDAIRAWQAGWSTAATRTGFAASPARHCRRPGAASGSARACKTAVEADALA